MRRKSVQAPAVAAAGGLATLPAPEVARTSLPHMFVVIGKCRATVVPSPVALAPFNNGGGRKIAREWLHFVSSEGTRVLTARQKIGVVARLWRQPSRVRRVTKQPDDDQARRIPKATGFAKIAQYST